MTVDEFDGWEQDEALFDVPEPPLRKAAGDYLRRITGTYDGLPFWALAPIDRYVRDHHLVDSDTSDFVWLLRGNALVWALVDVVDHHVIALDPAPIDRAIKEAMRNATRCVDGCMTPPVDCESTKDQEVH